MRSKRTEPKFVQEPPVVYNETASVPHRARYVGPFRPGTPACIAQERGYARVAVGPLIAPWPQRSWRYGQLGTVLIYRAFNEKRPSFLQTIGLFPMSAWSVTRAIMTT